jgi:hypothetical protein
MNITVNKIQRELVKKYGVVYADKEIIKDILIIIDDILRTHKNISIKK